MKPKNNKIEKSKWIIRMEIDAEALLEKNINMEDIHFAVKNSFRDEVSCIFTDYNSDKLIFRIRMNKILNNKKKYNKELIRWINLMKFICLKIFKKIY